MNYPLNAQQNNERKLQVLHAFENYSLFKKMLRDIFMSISVKENTHIYVRRFSWMKSKQKISDTSGWRTVSTSESLDQSVYIKK